MTRSTSHAECLVEGQRSAMDEQRPYRTEGERAVRASILGGILGLMLAMLARQRRDR